MRQTSKSWQSSSHQGRLGEMAAAPALVGAPICGKYPFMPSMPGKYDTKTHITKYPKNSLQCWMLKAATVCVVFINLRGKICDNLGQQLASWKSDQWGNVFEELKLHREQNDPAAAAWVRQPPLRPAQVGMKGRHIVPLLIISLRENTANVPLPPTCVSKHKHKNSFLCQSSATQLSDPDPAPGYHCNQASIYSPALHSTCQIALYFVYFTLLFTFPASSCLTARYRPRLSPILLLCLPPGSHPRPRFQPLPGGFWLITLLSCSCCPLLIGEGCLGWKHWNMCTHTENVHTDSENVDAFFYSS